MIDKQMKELARRNSSDPDILTTLKDFIADVKCILAAAGVKELKLLLKKHPDFSNFVNLVQGKKPKGKAGKVSS